jgi:hypothetical protein
MSISTFKTKFNDKYFSLLSDITDKFDAKHASHIALVEARTYWNDNSEGIVDHVIKSIEHCADEILSKDTSCLNKGNISLFTTIFKCKEHLDSENIYIMLTNEEGSKSVKSFWKTMEYLFSLSSLLELYKNPSIAEFIDMILVEILKRVFF